MLVALNARSIAVWLAQKSFCPTCRERCNVADVLNLNFELTRMLDSFTLSENVGKDAGMYEEWMAGLSPDQAKDVGQLHVCIHRGGND